MLAPIVCLHLSVDHNSVSGDGISSLISQHGLAILNVASLASILVHNRRALIH